MKFYAGLGAAGAVLLLMMGRQCNADSERCGVWNDRVVECSHDADPHKCRDVLLADPPDSCDVVYKAPPALPYWQLLEQQRSAP